MTSIVQDIHVVRSLRKDLRDTTLPSNILSAIETIQNCIKGGTDLNGWKKIGWREGGSGGSGSSRGGGHNSGNNNGSSHNSGNNNHSSSNNKGSFIGNRLSNKSQVASRDTSHSAFGFNRSRGGFNDHHAHEAVSIPLSGPPPHTSSHSSHPSHSSHSSSHPTYTVGADGFKTVTNKYVSKFKKSAEKVDDTILNTILLGKLNKFSAQNYDEIKEFITHIIDSGQTDMIKCFMKLVFEKAASEEMFCPLYAKLLSELSARYPVLLTEMANLYSQYMEIFEEIPEDSAENYNEVCKRNVEKKYRRGYSQFLAELIKHNIIDNDTFMKTVNKIISQIEINNKNKEAIKLNEEFADCFMKIMKAIQEDTSSESDSDSDTSSDDGLHSNVEIIRTTVKNTVSERIRVLTVRNAENVGMSNKARFTFLDIYEKIQKF